MDELWPWLNALPLTSTSSADDNVQWPRHLHLISSSSSDKSIVFTADRTAGSDSEAIATFSISLNGFSNIITCRTLWVADPCSLSNPIPSLLLQLLREVTSKAPSPPASLPPLNLNPTAVSAVMEVTDEAPEFLSLAMLCRLFYLCACEAPAEAGFLFFKNIEHILDRALNCRRVIGKFLLEIGADWETRFLRALGYMISKWCILRDLQQPPPPPPQTCNCYCISYGADLYGLWVLKGFAPVAAMPRITSAAPSSAAVADGAKETVIRYALSHQQLEAVVQLEYLVSVRDPRCIKISVRVDNIRIHVAQLGYGGDGGAGDDVDYDGASAARKEKHFPSRVRVWVGPEAGSAYAAALSLGRSTSNTEREIETTRIVKGSFSSVLKSAPATVNAKARSSARSRSKSWRWEQEADGGAAVFEGVLCDGETGAEVAAWRPGGGGCGGPAMRRRYNGYGRAFNKSGGVVVAADELPEAVTWRVGREMEGRRVRWRVGAKVWVSYFPNEVKSGYFETRCVEWNEDVVMHLVDM